MNPAFFISKPICFKRFNESDPSPLPPFGEYLWEMTISGKIQTVPSGEPDDPEDATITYVRGLPAISTAYPAHLLVKDGAAHIPV